MLKIQNGTKNHPDHFLFKINKKINRQTDKFKIELTVSKIIRKSLGPVAWGRTMATMENGRERTK
jgi:hypothetical protein